MDLSTLSFSDWALGSAILLLVLYKLGTWNHNYFASRGIKTVKTAPFLGSTSCLAFRTKAIADFVWDICKDFKDETIVGLLFFYAPILVIKDLELIKRITVEDFEHFTDHQQALSENADPLFTKGLFSLKGDRWRAMRATLSPAFTSRKMKNMFHFMNQCGQQLADYLQVEIQKNEPGKPYKLDMKDLFTRFTNDVIATSAFGIHIDSLKEKDNEFYRMGKQVTNFAGIKAIIILGYQLSPKLMEFLGVRFLTKKETSFFFDLVHDTLTTREREGIIRPDMMHLLMEARKGELKADVEEEEEITNEDVKAKKINLTEGDIASQAMLFFIAGFDTSSALLSFAAVLIAMHGDVQKRLQQEVDQIVGDDQEVTYEKVQKMKYLDMVISETLRIYPPTIAITRECTKNFTIPASDKHPEYNIKKGENLWVPVYGIHHDPEYYPEPETFNPERFSEENKQNIKPFTYLPFGVGPRLCIGQRFALLEAKVAIIHIMLRFNLTVVDKTKLPLRLDRNGFAMNMEGGFWVGASSRKELSV